MSASTVIAKPITAATRKTSAMPRASPSPSSQPKVARPASVPMYGISQNSAIGPTRNVLNGAAPNSSAIANPKTRPCCGNGTTFCSTVCSDASANVTRPM